MRVKAYLTLREMQDLLGEKSGRTLRGWLIAKDVLVAMPGSKYRTRVSTARLRDALPDFYERLAADSRYWEDMCAHRAQSVRSARGQWCADCGAITVDGEWQQPAVTAEVI